MGYIALLLFLKNDPENQGLYYFMNLIIPLTIGIQSQATKFLIQYMYFKCWEQRPFLMQFGILRT